LLLIALPGIPQAEAQFYCGSMPAAVTEVNRNVKSDISASVGALGKIGAVSIGAETEVEAQNLFSKYPNIDRLLALQMMSSTYCTMLRGSSIPDSEKLDRWERFQDKILALKSAPPASASSPIEAIPQAHSSSGSSKPLRRKDDWVETRDPNPGSQDALSISSDDLGKRFAKQYCVTARGGNIVSCDMDKEYCDAGKSIYGCLLRPEKFLCYAEQELGKIKTVDCSVTLKKCREDFDAAVVVRNMYKKPIRFSYGCFEISPPQLQQ
jgi:hypothetical protein